MRSEDDRKNSGALTAMLAPVLVSGMLAIPGCDETLPPRDDPQGFLDVAWSPAGGTVVLEKDLRPFSTFLGGYYVSVRNLHDEVLQAVEDVDIRISYDLEADTTSGSVIGDWTTLVDKSMIEYDSLLTIQPGETARFFVAVDHTGERLWERSQLVFHREPGQQQDITWLETGDIVLVGSGSATFFKSVAGHELSESRLVIRYYISVDPPFFPIDSLRAEYDPGTGYITLEWLTPFEFGAYGFEVERGRTPNDLTLVSPDLMRARGFFPDTTYYAWTDSSALSAGTWWYRLQRWFNFGFAQVPIEPTELVSVQVP